MPSTPDEWWGFLVIAAVFVTTIVCCAVFARILRKAWATGNIPVKGAIYSREADPIYYWMATVTYATVIVSVAAFWIVMLLLALHGI